MLLVLAARARLPVVPFPPHSEGEESSPDVYVVCPKLRIVQRWLARDGRYVRLNDVRLRKEHATRRGKHRQLLASVRLLPKRTDKRVDPVSRAMAKTACIWRGRRGAPRPVQRVAFVLAGWLLAISAGALAGQGAGPGLAGDALAGGRWRVHLAVGVRRSDHCGHEGGGGEAHLFRQDQADRRS